MRDNPNIGGPSASVTTIRLGAATLTIVNVGDSLWSLAEELDLSEAERAAHPDLFIPRLFAGQCVHVALAGASVLVDASIYDYAPDTPQVPPGYTPPPSLLAALASRGIAPDVVRHVVITHPHFDHINGLTRPDDSHPNRPSPEAEGACPAPLQPRPCFPHARHYLGARDWDAPEMQAALADADSLEAHTLGMLHALGLLEPVAGEREIAPGVRIVPAPGETPGHQIVRIESEGRVAYCFGDLFHAVEEVARPDWMVTWAERAAMGASRRALFAAARAEDALLIAAHIPGAGRLIADDFGAGVRWQPVG